MPKMKAAIFVEPGRIVLAEKPMPEVGPLDALIRITTTTICGTDVDRQLRVAGPSVGRPSCKPIVRAAMLSVGSGRARSSSRAPFRILHKRYPDEDLADALWEGITTGHPSMPEFRLDAAQVNNVIAYLKTLQH